jgi:quinolinate synthase
MDVKTLQSKILELKTEKNALLLVHNYQREEIQEIADHLGDSLALSRLAASASEDIIVFCGVRFMAESAKILAPDKKILLPRPDAGCPMADMVTPEDLKAFKAVHPDAVVVAYVNTSADVKAEADVCCTSANALKVVKNIEGDKIIMVPDRNLAAYVQRFVDKEIIPWDGYCYVHRRFEKNTVKKAKESKEGAVLVVHPECDPDVIDQADGVESTDGMVRVAKSNDQTSLLIGTEEGLVRRLRRENPGKEIYSAGPPLMCYNMKKTTLQDVYDSLRFEQHEVEVPERIRTRAKKALDEMLKHV